MSHDQSRPASTLLGFKVLSSQPALHSSGRFPHTHTFPSCDVSSNNLASSLTHNLNLLASSHTPSSSSHSSSDISMVSSHEHITALPPLIDVSDTYLLHSSSALPHPSHIRRRTSNPSISSAIHVTSAETRRATPHATHTPYPAPSHTGVANGSGNSSKPPFPRKHSRDRFKVAADVDAFSESSPRTDTRTPRPDLPSTDTDRRMATEAECSKKAGNAPRPPSGTAHVLTSPRKKPAQPSSLGKRTSGKTSISGDLPSGGASSARKASLAIGRVLTGKATVATTIAAASPTANANVGGPISTATVIGSPVRKHARPADTQSRQPCPPHGPPPLGSHSRRTRTLNAATTAIATAVPVLPVPALSDGDITVASGACLDVRSRAMAETGAGLATMLPIVPRDSPRRTLQPHSPSQHSAAQSGLLGYVAAETTTASITVFAAPVAVSAATAVLSATISSPSFAAPFAAPASTFLSPECALATETWDTVIPTRTPEPLQCTCVAVPPSVLSVGDKAGYFHARLSEPDADTHTGASTGVEGAAGALADVVATLADDDDDHYLHMRITRRPARARTEAQQLLPDTHPHAHNPAVLTEAGTESVKSAGSVASGRVSSNFAVSAGRRGRAACPVHGGGRGLSEAPATLTPAAMAAAMPVPTLDRGVGVDMSGVGRASAVRPTAAEVEIEAQTKGDVNVGAGVCGTVGGVAAVDDDAACSDVAPCAGVGSDGEAGVCVREAVGEQAHEAAEVNQVEEEAAAEAQTDVGDCREACTAGDTDDADPASISATQARKTGKKGKSKSKKQPEAPTAPAASVQRPEVKAKKTKDTKKDRKDKKDKGEKAEGKDRRQSSGAERTDARVREAATEGAGGADALALAALLRVQAHRKQLQTDKLRQEEQEWLRRNQRQLRQREEDAVVAWERARMYMVNHAYQLLVERQFQEFVEAKRKGKETSRAVINFS